ncbi:MAG: phosphosulfolactate synthase [Bacteroidota bacterium]
MNFSLTKIPSRSAKPRTEGLTMVIDKGLSVRQIEDLLEVSTDFIDVIKFGWATSAVVGNLDEKVKVYHKYNIPFYFGGTMLEAFYIRNQVDEFEAILEKYGATYVEVSDGSVDMSAMEKAKLIERFAKNYTVLSEVGSKTADKIIPPYKWVEMMQGELNAGSWKVIAEARESGTVGMFRGDGKVRSDLVDEILQDVPGDKILGEAPQKSQQVWFIKLLGTNVNLGNIAPSEVIPLETIRRGLRGDTFHTFLED